MKLLIEELDGLKRDLQFAAQKEYDDAEQDLCADNCRFLWDYEAQIMQAASVSLDVILYSLYYWMQRLCARMAECGVSDAGAEQQRFQLIEEIESRLGSVDFALLEQIERENGGEA